MDKISDALIWVVVRSIRLVGILLVLTVLGSLYRETGNPSPQLVNATVTDLMAGLVAAGLLIALIWGAFND